MSTIIFLIISILLGFVCYLATTSLIPSLIVLIISLILFMFISNKLVKKYQVMISRYHSCYRFMNNMIISLSVKKTLSGALPSVLEQMDEDFIKEYKDLDHFLDNEKIEYLKKYYRFHIYDLFVDVVNLFIEQGGNILSMSSLIIEQSRNIEEFLNSSHKIGTRKIVEFAVLWIFSIAILLALRMVLSEYYMLISSKLFFQISVAALLLFIAFSIHLLILRFTNVKIRGYSYEKV